MMLSMLSAIASGAGCTGLSQPKWASATTNTPETVGRGRRVLSPGTVDQPDPRRGRREENRGTPHEIAPIHSLQLGHGHRFLPERVRE